LMWAVITSHAHIGFHGNMHIAWGLVRMSLLPYDHTSTDSLQFTKY